jgi:hypothetical protein
MISYRCHDDNDQILYYYYVSNKLGPTAVHAVLAMYKE